MSFHFPHFLLSGAGKQKSIWAIDIWRKEDNEPRILNDIQLGYAPSQYTGAHEQGVNIMVLLRENFIQLQYVGLWRPPCWPPNDIRSRVYWFYTMYILIIIHCFTLSEALSLFTVIESIEDFSDNCFMLLTVLAICVKSVVTLARRSEIIDILTALDTYPFKPMNIDEERIQEYFNKRIRVFTYLYGGTVEFSVWIMSISAFFQGIPFGVLPYKAWLPYDYSKSTVYWFTFCAQLVIVITVANICIGCDTVMPGFYTIVSAQFNILRCRLEKVIDAFDAECALKPREMISIHRERCEKRIITCVQYHRAIIEISQKINSITSSIIFVQYLASSIIICLIIFILSQMPLFSSQFLYFAVYLTCMLFQIFLFCASANEATTEVIKSSHDPEKKTTLKNLLVSFSSAKT
ncbi:odorant receptor Or1-like [Diachasmimorpha longicaudata]|uniref:odorant receptor Or1-like n=1 Tax=Diachasmimorpha longicaudata TaxID=58733 RepID=UPI0030B90D80